MIERVIAWSVHNRVLVLLATLIWLIVAVTVVRGTAVDTIPDLSDVQVIVKTSYAGQAPQIVQDQVTYPLTTALLSVPGAEMVRGFSFFGDSYVYVIFDDDTDLATILFQLKGIAWVTFDNFVTKFRIISDVGIRRSNALHDHCTSLGIFYN